MPQDTPPLATLFDPLELQAAAAACCGRFGDPDVEARRLVALRDMVARASELARELDGFARTAATHLRGVHCTASLQPEAERLAHATSAWLERVQDAANAYRDWQELRTLAELREQGDGPPSIAPPVIGSISRSFEGARVAPSA
jgi:hypothetical protein